MGQFPLHACGETEARSFSADGLWPGQTQNGRLPFPFLSTLDLPLGPGILLGRQEGVGVTGRQVSGLCLLVCKMGIVTPTSGVVVGIK